jgi:hypothetical protein
MLNPKRDGIVESHPSAKCAEGWGTRGSKNSRSIFASRGSLCVLKLTDLDGSFRELGDDS